MLNSNDLRKIDKCIVLVFSNKMLIVSTNSIHLKL